MKHEQLVKTIHDVVASFGEAQFLERHQVGFNSPTYSSLEHLFSVQSDAQGTTLVEDLKAKIAAHLELLTAEGVVRSFNGETQRLSVVTHTPIFTYREPMVNEIPNGVLYSVSIGFPLFVA